MGWYSTHNSTKTEICPVGLMSDYWRRKNQGKGGTRKWETPRKNFGVGLASFLPSFLPSWKSWSAAFRVSQDDTQHHRQDGALIDFSQNNFIPAAKAGVQHIGAVLIVWRWVLLTTINNCFRWDGFKLCLGLSAVHPEPDCLWQRSPWNSKRGSWAFPHYRGY